MKFYMILYCALHTPKHNFILCLLVLLAILLAVPTILKSQENPSITSPEDRQNRKEKQPARRTLGDPKTNNQANNQINNQTKPSLSPPKFIPSDEEGKTQGPNQPPNKPTEGTDTSETESQTEPSVPYPPYPNYPESNKPRPPRSPRQQEYLYLHHLYFSPFELAAGGFISFGWLGMLRAGRALRLGLEIYNPGTNIDIIVNQRINDPDYFVTALLLRLGLHFFIEPKQLKGFEFGLDLLSGIAVLPASGNAIVAQAALEIPISYRFVISFYSGTGRQTFNIGIAPYGIFSLGTYLSTSGTVSALVNSDPGLSAYVTNGLKYLQPGTTTEVGPVIIRFSFRFGFDVSIVL